MAQRSITKSKSETRWEQYYDTIKWLYLVEDRSLCEVRQVMSDEFHFPASKQQYERHFKTWGWRKNLKQHEWLVVDQLIRYRRSLGKSSEVTIGGVPLPAKKVQKELDRYRNRITFSETPLATDLTMPDGINVSTPLASPTSEYTLNEMPFPQAELEEYCNNAMSIEQRVAQELSWKRNSNSDSDEIFFSAELDDNSASVPKIDVGFDSLRMSDVSPIYVDHAVGGNERNSSFLYHTKTAEPLYNTSTSPTNYNMSGIHSTLQSVSASYPSNLYITADAVGCCGSMLPSLYHIEQHYQQMHAHENIPQMPIITPSSTREQIALDCHNQQSIGLLPIYRHTHGRTIQPRAGVVA